MLSLLSVQVRYLALAGHSSSTLSTLSTPFLLQSIKLGKRILCLPIPSLTPHTPILSSPSAFNASPADAEHERCLQRVWVSLTLSSSVVLLSRSGPSPGEQGLPAHGSSCSLKGDEAARGRCLSTKHETVCYNLLAWGNWGFKWEPDPWKGRMLKKDPSVARATSQSSASQGGWKV